MAAETIRLLGDSVLRKRAEEVAVVGKETDAIIDRLIESVDEAGGLGLAANQIGSLKRVIVVVAVDGDGAAEEVVVAG